MARSRPPAAALHCAAGAGLPCRTSIRSARWVEQLAGIWSKTTCARVTASIRTYVYNFKTPDLGAGHDAGGSGDTSLGFVIATSGCRSESTKITTSQRVKLQVRGGVRCSEPSVHGEPAVMDQENSERVTKARPSSPTGADPRPKTARTKFSRGLPRRERSESIVVRPMDRKV